MQDKQENNWAVVLGGSSGFGLAAAKELASKGYKLCVVHRDRRGALPRISESFREIQNYGTELLTFNLDALSSEGITTVISGLEEAMSGAKVRLLLHSIAFGSLKLIAPLKTPAPNGATYETDLILDPEEMLSTVNAMGVSLLTWTQALFKQKLFAADARVIGLTSEGNEVAWLGYAAVSAAKTALEAVSRSIAKEFGPHGIRSNIVQPGVTDTPALRMIPGSENLVAAARSRNPLGRLTEVEDVARVIAFLASDEAKWINGSLIRVDGGERISG